MSISSSVLLCPRRCQLEIQEIQVGGSYMPAAGNIADRHCWASSTGSPRQRTVGVRRTLPNFVKVRRILPILLNPRRPLLQWCLTTHTDRRRSSLDFGMARRFPSDFVGVAKGYCRVLVDGSPYIVAWQGDLTTIDTATVLSNCYQVPCTFNAPTGPPTGQFMPHSVTLSQQ